jgi:ubiquinone/menaquinone biosynthesis C-methylase UbiE
MRYYEQRVLPHVIDWSMRRRTFNAYRRRIVGQAAGCVLEIGVGSGLNLPFYGSAVVHVIGIDPSPGLLSIGLEAGGAASPSLALLQGSAEAIPLENECVDTVVSTWTLCSIPNVSRALEEIRRVLRKDGRFLFVEHGLSPDRRVSGWQNRLTPLWRRIAGGCHLNRPIAGLIEGAGFRLESVTTGYMEGPRPMTFMYEGSAYP